MNDKQKKPKLSSEPISSKETDLAYDSSEYPVTLDDSVEDSKEKTEQCCDSMEMPRYRSHKEVWALKIKSIVFDSDLANETNRETDGSATITPDEEGYAPFEVDASYVRKHNPVAGGYYVVYKDGYKSFSPADAFENGNALVSKLPLHITDPFEWMKQWIDAYSEQNGGASGEEIIEWIYGQPMTRG